MDNIRCQISGSSAERWLNCPGSVWLSDGIKEANRAWAIEGTDAHARAATALCENLSPTEDIRCYVNYVREHVAKYPKHLVVTQVERRLRGFIRGESGASGQLDCYLVAGSEAHIFDLKYGRGEPVFATNNMQLAFYACLLQQNYTEIKHVTVHIVQPRVANAFFPDEPNISSWQMGEASLSFYSELFEEGIQQVIHSRSLRAGKHCKYCKAFVKCPIQKQKAETAQRLASSLETNPREVSIQEIADILRYRPDITKFFDRAEELILSEMEEGKQVAGWSLGRKRSIRKWLNLFSEDEIAEELIKRGVKNPWKKKLIPITEAEREIDIDGLFDRPEGGVTIRMIKD